MPRLQELNKELIDEISRKYPDLESLNLSRNEIRALTNELSRLGGSLKSLDISENAIERIESLEGFPELVELNLSGNRIHLFNVSRLPPKLECLDLSENMIGSFSLPGKNKTLRHLRLSGNPVMREENIEIRLCEVFPMLLTLNGKRVSEIIMSSEKKTLRLQSTAIVSLSPGLEQIERVEAQCKAMATLLRDQEREICTARSETEKIDGESNDRTEARARAFERLLRGWRKKVFSLMVNRNANQLQYENEMSKMRRQISAESSVRRRLNETLRREREMREAGDREISLLRSALELRDAAISERDRQNQDLVRKTMLSFQKIFIRERRRVEMEVERRVATLEGRIRFAYNRLRLLRSARPMREETREAMLKLRTETERLSKMLKRERLEKVRIKEERESLSRVNTNYVSEMEEWKRKVQDFEEEFESLRMKLRDRDLRIEELQSEIKKVRSERNALLIAMRDNQEQEERRRNEVVALPDKVEEDVALETSEEEEEEEVSDAVSTQQKTDRVRYIRRRVLNVEQESKEHEDRRGPKIKYRSPTQKKKTRSHTEQDERENQIERTMRALDELEALSVDLLSDDY